MEQKNNLLIPASIVLAGFLVAGGIYLSDRGNNPTTGRQVQNEIKASDIAVLPVTKDDHILGDPNAPIVLVEFSDTECPFCKMFHTTMKTVMNTYGKDGKVAWVYRHFPIDGLHPKARNEAESAECVQGLGGSTAFWKYLDTIYANTPSNNGLDETKLPEFAKAAGVDVDKFNTCLASDKYADFITTSVNNAQKAGANGTPYNILILKDALSIAKATALSTYIANNGLSEYVTISRTKKEIALSGALPLDILKAIIDPILK